MVGGAGAHDSRVELRKESNRDGSDAGALEIAVRRLLGLVVVDVAVDRGFLQGKP